MLSATPNEADGARRKSQAEVRAAQAPPVIPRLLSGFFRTASRAALVVTPRGAGLRMIDRGAAPQGRHTLAKALIITEKPSVANDIAKALGGFTEHDGWFESDDHVLTFAVGHLFELLPPEEIDDRYKRWTLDVLPILPDEFRYKPKQGQSERVRTIRRLLERKDVDSVINACDAGREGELIFREIVEHLGSQKPIRRLWLQSMTDE